MESHDFVCVLGMAFAYSCIFLCHCYRKSRSGELVALFIVAVSVAPLLLKDRHVLSLFFTVFSFFLLIYFEVAYERRVRALGQGVNEAGEYHAQYELLPRLVNCIARRFLKRNFSFYSSKLGELALLDLTNQKNRLLVDAQTADTYVQALRFVYEDIHEKWGEPARGHGVTFFIERLNRNLMLYLSTVNVWNMAEIHDAAKRNLQALLALYYYNFHLKEPNDVEWESSAAFAYLHREFEASLAKFPVRLELA